MANNNAGMTLIVKTITRFTVGLILIYGIYIVFRGHISIGGGFAGGLIAALSFIHLMLAFGREEVAKKLSKPKCLLFMGLGGLALLFFAMFGFLGGTYLAVYKEYFKIFSGGKIPPTEIAISVMAGAGLSIAFMALVMLMRPREEK